ncbi:MAG: LysM peptidoglycan-binding domain-containing protein, partial [Acidobacteria bacterium]|nr:LysM peptidoglycan-binding domain-containing protein [Acidobacteriota bacterium]
MRHFNHLARGFGALILIVLFVVGVPVGLTAYVGWPLPTTLPTFDEIQLALRSGINPQLLINTLAVVVWFTWAQLVIAFAAEAAAAIGGRTTRRLPVLPGLQPAVAQLVAAITLAVAGLGPLRVVPAAATPVQTQVVELAYPGLELDDQPAGTAEPDAVLARGDSVETVGPSYRVGRHDTFWQVAETTLGDGRRWQEIRDQNIGRTMADGRSITETTDRLTPGWLIILPDGAQVPEEAVNTQDQTLTEITVERGDNFWTIAEEALETAWGRAPTDAETADYWRHVVDTNRHRLLPPHDPDLIYPGQVFRLPSVSEDPGTGSTEHTTDENAATTEITVERGDHFWVIAERTLADTWRRPPTTTETVSYWRKVIDVNLDRLRPPHDPSLIYPGQVFQLPPVPSDPTMSVFEENTDGVEPSDRPRTTERPFEAATTPDVAREGDAVETPTPHDQTQSTFTRPVTPSAEPPPTTETREETIVASETDPGASQPGETDDQEEEQDGLLPTVAPLAGLGLLAAGIIALIGRLRRSQLRQRKPDTVPTPPPPATKKTEARLRAAAAPTATELIDLALRALAHQIIDHHTPPPQVVGVHLDSDILRLLLWSAHHDPPPGWKVDDDGHSWTLPTSIDLTHLHLLADSTPAPYPPLVTVGHPHHS